MNYWNHLKTILKHKKWVWHYGRKMGIGRRTFWHDMSKFTPVEFFESCKYWTGTRSPIDVCKEVNGYSMAWQFHKGRNPHHYEFWMDNYDKGGQALRIPSKYVREMFCDFLAAGRTYTGPSYNFVNQYNWWQNKRKCCAMHKDQILFFDYMFKWLVELFYEQRVDTLTQSDWKVVNRVYALAEQQTEWDESLSILGVEIK